MEEKEKTKEPVVEPVKTKSEEPVVEPVKTKSEEPSAEEKFILLEQYAQQLKERESALHLRELELRVPENNRVVVKKLMKADGVGIDDIQKIYPHLFEGKVAVKAAVNWEIFKTALTPKVPGNDEQEEKEFMARMEKDGSEDSKEIERYLAIKKRGRK